MARSEARLQFGMWRDGLEGLSPHAKLLYVVLLTEPTVNHAGVGAIRESRWARNASLTPDEMRKALDELTSGRFVLVDDDTEELFVRTMIRNDGVADQPNVLKGALREALHTASPAIRKALAVELRRLPPKRPDGVSKAGHRVVYPDPHAVADRLDPRDAPPPTRGYTDPEPFQNPSESLPEPSREPFGKPSRTPGGGGGGGGEGSVGINSSSGHRAAATNTDAGFADFWAAYPRKVKKQDAEKAWRQVLRRKVDPEHVIAAAKIHAGRWRAQGKDLEFIPYPASWLRGGSYDDETPDAAAVARRDVWTVPDDQLTDADVDELLGPGQPPEPPDEFEFWDRDRRHAWNRDNSRRWRTARRAQAARVRAERLARVTRLDDHRRDTG